MIHEEKCQAKNRGSGVDGAGICAVLWFPPPRVWNDPISRDRLHVLFGGRSIGGVWFGFDGVFLVGKIPAGGKEQTDFLQGKVEAAPSRAVGFILLSFASQGLRVHLLHFHIPFLPFQGHGPPEMVFADRDFGVRLGG